MGIVDELRQVPRETLEERVARRNAEEAERQRQAEVAFESIAPRWARAWRNSGIPARHRERVWDTRNERMPTHTAQMHAIIRRGGLAVVCGRCGVGKTHGAIRAALAWAHDNPLGTICYTTESDMHAAYVDAVRGGGSVVGALAANRDPDLLIVDEVLQRPRGVDAQHLTDGASGAASLIDWLIERVVDMRYGDEKPLILIGNKSREDFGKALGRRVASRVQEAGGCVEYGLDAKSWRKAIAESDNG